MPKKKQILYPVFFMILITVLFTTSLAFINELSADTIDRQALIKKQSKILYSLNIYFDKNTNNIIDTYNKTIVEKKLGNTLYYEASIDNNPIGYAFEINGPGLWGNINAILAIDSNFENLIGVNFISHSETPGLGGRIDEYWFTEQFRNISLKKSDNSDYLIFKPSIGGNVDSISGATNTTKAVLKLFNENIDNILNVLKGDIV